MAKSKLMRPSWVCLKLCGGDTISALMLTEILFRANVTKYHDDGCHIIVFSYQEWSDNTGLSVGQVRKALKRLEKLNIIKTYNKKHPHKAVLRALHVAVVKELWVLWLCLTSDDYNYDGDILYADHADIELCLSVAGCSQYIGGTPAVPPADISACPEGTNLSIYKNNTKDYLNAAAQSAAEIGKNKIKKEEIIEKKVGGYEYDIIDGDGYDIPDSLKRINNMPVLLDKLFCYNLKYFNDNPITTELFDISCEATKLWLKLHGEYYGSDIKIDVEMSMALFEMLAVELKADLIDLVKKTIPNWGNFTHHVQTNNILGYVPPMPEVEFFYHYRQYAIKYDLSSLQEQAAC